MSFIGGDILEISYKHPTLGSGTWFPKAGEDLTLDSGGYTSADESDGITSDGQPINKINRKRWMCECSVAWDMANNDEVDKASKLAASPVDADFTFAHISGVVWGGKGRPVGDIQGSTKDAQMKIKISGGGELKKQS
jgi:hypothetical protein